MHIKRHRSTGRPKGQKKGTEAKPAKGLPDLCFVVVLGRRLFLKQSRRHSDELQASCRHGREPGHQPRSRNTTLSGLWARAVPSDAMALYSCAPLTPPLRICFWYKCVCPLLFSFGLTFAFCTAKRGREVRNMLFPCSSGSADGGTI